MKKGFKWVLIAIASFVGLTFWITIISMCTSETQNTNAVEPTIKLTQSQIDSIGEVKRIALRKAEIDRIKAELKHLDEFMWKANNVLALYAENEIRADEGLKNKKVIVTGVVQDIGKDIRDRPYLLVGDYNYANIQAVFATSEMSTLRNLKKGNTVYFEGICKGSLVNVVIENCRFIDSPSKLKKLLKEYEAYQ